MHHHVHTDEFSSVETILSHVHPPSFAQAVSFNRMTTPAISSTASSTIELNIEPAETSPHLFTHFKHSQRTDSLMEFYRRTEKDASALTIIPHQSRRYSSPSHQRKLPRHLELTNDLYTVINASALNQNYTNNAHATMGSSSSRHRQEPMTKISLEREQSDDDEDIDSSV